MLEETAGKLEQNQAHSSTSQCGRGAEPPTPVVTDKKEASEKAAREEVVRARNKRVRAPRSAPGAGSPPPFADHSGQL